MKYLLTTKVEKYSLIKSDDFKVGKLSDFIAWISNNTIFQLDTETTFVPDDANVLDNRELLLIQLGSIDKKVQWLLDFTVFHTDQYHEVLKELFENTDNIFIAHNVRFEYVVIKHWLDIRVENVHDTFLMSKVLNTGYDLEKGYHSLAGAVKRFFNIELSKEDQTTFTKELMSISQIEYAASDVLYLFDLFIKLKEILIGWGLWDLYNKVEREVVKVYGDMELNKMRFDENYWNSLILELQDDDKLIEEDLNNFVFNDPKLVNYLKKSNLVIGLSLVQPKDKLNLNWASNITRKLVLQKIIPELKDIGKFTKPELKKLYKAEGTLENKSSKLLKLYLDRDFTTLNRYLKVWFKPWLINNKLFIKENTVLINWSSHIHKLHIFQFYYPKLESTNAKAINRITSNKLINKFKEYSKVHKYRTTYGENFRNKYVDRHSKIGPTGCRQILNTGRVAFGILLQMPGQARFRNGFLPPKDDWVFVDSDYDGAELAIMAWLAQENSLLEVIRNGQDAHMFVTEKLFPEEWKNGAEEDCIHLTTGKRCECVEHNKLRKNGKTFNFGIPFGMTHVGLADRLDKSRSEAKIMLDKYYNTFPALKKFFEKSEKFGIENNFITGAKPTFRKRFFHNPANEGEKQAIGREAKNFKIQAGNADMLKIALIKLRKYILKNNFPAKLHLPVHDEILSSCHKDKADEWLLIQEKAMKDAADLFLEQGLLTVGSKIMDRWTK